MSENKCFFCENEAKVKSTLSVGIDSTRYDCVYCGTYLLDDLDRDNITDSETKFKIACVLNERRLKELPGIAIDEKTNPDDPVLSLPRIALQDLLNDFPKKASDYFNRAILNLSRLPKRPFEIVKITPKNDYQYFFSKTPHDAVVFLRELKDQGLIKFNSQNMEDYGIFLTIDFWELVDSLQKAGVDSKQAFVAMWFDSSMDDYYKEGIEPAVEDAGYDAVRIDAKDFNGKICDEIIAEINRSKFIVSDFSGQRGGVYFEAGYGMGQGKPVIFTVREEDVKGLHFDTRQYNHIVYSSPEDLKKKLYNRICATIV